MLVYHGSYTAIEKPDLAAGRHNLDFGRGYYITTLASQAEKWALRKGQMESKPAMVSVYSFDTSNLNIRYFEGYTAEWLDFVINSRAGTQGCHPYDAIFGNIADDDVAAVVNDYIRLLEKGRITPSGKAFYLEQLQFSKPNDQYCITTQKGIDNLQFIRSYTLEVPHV